MSKQNTVSAKLSPEQYKHVLRLVHQLSLEKNLNLGISDIIKEAIENTFPMPKKKNKDINV